MEPNGQDVGQRIRNAIKSKLIDIGCYVDDDLPEYVMVMIANKKTKEQMKKDLSLFLGDYCNSFCDWLHQVLDHLQRYAREGKHKLELFDAKAKPKERPQEDGMSLHPDAEEQNEFEDTQQPESTSKAAKKQRSPPRKTETRTRKRLKDRVEEVAKEVKKQDEDLRDHSPRKRIEIEEPKKESKTRRRSRERTPERKKSHRESTSKKETKEIPKSPAKKDDQPSERKVEPRKTRSSVAVVPQKSSRPKHKSETDESDDDGAEYDPSKPSLRSVAQIVPRKRLVVDKKSLQKNKILSKALLDANRSTTGGVDVIQPRAPLRSKSKRSIQDRLGSYVTEAIAQKVAQRFTDIPPSLEDDAYEPSASKPAAVDAGDLRSRLKRKADLSQKEGPELPTSRIRKEAVKRAEPLPRVTENAEPAEPLPKTSEPNKSVPVAKKTPEDEKTVLRNGMIVKPSPLLEACGLNAKATVKRPIESPGESNGDSCAKKVKSDISSKIPLKSLDDLVSPKAKIMRKRCKFDPECTNSVCPFAHPGQPCPSFPHCGLKAAVCTYRHPPCYYDKNCSNRLCAFTHKADGMPPPEEVRPTQCKFFPNCTSTSCPFYHPPIPCKFGLRCQSIVCPFVHPEKSTVAKLKWVAS